MKLHYNLELTVRGIGDKISLRFTATEWQANKAFDGFRVAFHESIFQKVELQVIGKKKGEEIPVTLKRENWG